MTADDFNEWVHDMRDSRRAKTMKQLAEMLDVDRTTLYAMVRRGGSKRDALACAALLEKIKPYGDDK